MKTLIWMVAALTLAATAVAQTVKNPLLVVEKVITDGALSLPVSMAFIGANDLLICEQFSGRVNRIIDGVVQAAPVLTLPVYGQGEQGLLGMALHPEFATNNYVYFFYTKASGISIYPTIGNRVSRFTWNGSVLLNEELIIYLPSSSGPHHNGGIILFGPPNAAPQDQKLFIVIGDLSRTGQTTNSADGEAPNNSAVILRVNPDGTAPSGAEKGPFFDVAGDNASLQITYAYGVRNSFGMDFDPVSNALWDTENGPNRNDEINLVEPGFNSGWRIEMGFVVPPPTTLVTFSGVGTYSNPEFTWQSVVAPTAIHFYRGSNLGKQYENDCFVGSFNTGKLYRFEPDTERDSFTLAGDLADTVWDSGESDAQIVFGSGFGPITDICTGPDGNLYILTINPDMPGASNMLYRIRPVANAAQNWALYN